MSDHSENPVRQRLFDREHGRLVYVGEAATPELWDSLWSLDADSVARWTAPSRGHDRLVRLTRRFVRPEDGLILEGGCGRGQYVAALQRAGFQVVGLDFAEATVRALNTYAPQLDIRCGDLRSIPLPDASLAAYWSLGVIEHFWEGYDPLAAEMGRVIRDGGYLFCSFPYLSPLRRLKAAAGLYSEVASNEEPPGFYQFALPMHGVIRRLDSIGFDFVSARASSGLKGIEGEMGWLSRSLKPLYEYEGASLLLRGLRRALDDTLGRLGAGHSVLTIFRRRARAP